MKNIHGLHVLIARDDDSSTTLTPTMVKLLIALVVLVVATLLLAGGLLMLRSMKRRARQQQASELPLYNEKRSSRRSNHKRLTISASKHDCVHIYQEKHNTTDSRPSTPGTPSSPIPEIRITFPEEVDEEGKKHSGKVVVVRVGEHSVGMEPVAEDLPAYDEKERFQSLDLERIGGLKEKEISV